ncbi:hypothetical protein LTR91_006334 [Friedmanniomyces endolithicus]|uniref:Peptide hydrolase n=1 Tax=Friedmanniomyces endolithicus TaxID=329885 RepID=A0AAN6J6S1_9PEZI|nr:hypothetical protein LTS09_010801 [Friedmanniomyces endolithicus]KAK0274339.1 hypothetical protein LTS00_015471 [Friedmanniomyces endolithicus]KAK0290144.1 hypothetical protein LTR35_002086 [Friedmanniomyces endolithicus]KAK0305549.1 hypothetical protein LTR01_006696 [Friedmanniomyces endolithicus]KAK0319348.1 hypothetical protein LTR82_009765 [Friedmanniomyces endolithicus]
MKLTRLIGVVFAACQAAARENEQVVFAGRENAVAPLSVAIIDAEDVAGAGAGGASTAYHLRKFAAASGFAVNITVFERNDYIGGRSTTVDVYDDPMNPVELGASIFVKANHILESAVTAGC